MKNTLIIFFIMFLVLGNQASAQILTRLTNLENRLAKIESTGTLVSENTAVVDIDTINDTIAEIKSSHTEELLKLAAGLNEVKKTQEEISSAGSTSESVDTIIVDLAVLQEDIATLKTANQTTESLSESKDLNLIAADLKNLIGELKTEYAQQLETVNVLQQSKPEGLVFSGDFRLRNETIDLPDKAQRNRQRIRARLTVAGTMNDEFSFVMRLASGSSDSPISTNNTLDGGFTSKSMWIDRAYIQWKPKAYNGLSLKGGKVGNPFVVVGKSQLLWDGDVNPEGVSVNYSRSGSTADFFLNAASFAIDERKATDNAWLLGGQAGSEFSADSFTLTAGAGYYTFSNAKGNTAFIDGSGNSLDADGGYLNDYKEFEVFAELGTKFNSLPLAFYANGVQNTGADKDNMGYLAGINVGKCKKEGSWEFKYNYEHLEKDAVIGSLTDSDFAGGGTDGKGHKFGLGYQLSSPVKLAATYLLNETAIEGGSEYHRVQIDLSCKFK